VLRPLPKSVILDVYAAYVRRLGGWLAIADLTRLMGDLGYDEQSVRSAISRMKKAGLLRAATHSGMAGYRLTDETLGILREGDERIFKNDAAADLAEGWVVAVFSVPERERDRRHQLRSRLIWLGYGQMAPRVWIAPRRMLTDTKRILERTGLSGYVHLFEGAYAGFDGTRDLVARTWDLSRLTKLYQGFLRTHERVLRRWTASPERSDREAFVDYTFALAEWRRLLYMDPGLPSDLLPLDWVGDRARSLFRDLSNRLEYRAVAHVLATVRLRETD
jgi:phenylacetic acid degradation operon negative regulatory protein